MKREQIIAYNFLFSDCHINEMTLEQTLKHLDRRSEELRGKRFNPDLIRQCITKNFDSYKTKPFIAASKSEVYERLPL